MNREICVDIAEDQVMLLEAVAEGNINGLETAGDTGRPKRTKM